MGYYDRNQNSGKNTTTRRAGSGYGFDYGGRPTYPRPIDEVHYQQPIRTREQVLREEHIVFKNKCYSTQQLALLCRTGSKIVIRPDDMHKDALTLVDTQRGAEAKTFARTVVTQYEGKFVVLMGHDIFAKANGKPSEAYLISNVVLKKAHIWDN